MLVDYEQAWLDLKELISSKRSHGADTLLVEMARMEIACKTLEGLPEKALRLYGQELAEALVPAVSPPEEGTADGANEAGALVAPVHRSIQEEHHAADPGTRGREARGERAAVA